MNTDDQQESKPELPTPSPWGRAFKHRNRFTVLLVAACSLVGAFFGAHYGASRDVEPYYGPRPATGLDLPTSGEVIAAIWGAVPGLALGCLLGFMVQLLKIQMDIPPTKHGTPVSPMQRGAWMGCAAGFFAGLISGGTHSWIHGTAAGTALAIVIGVLGHVAADKDP